MSDLQFGLVLFGICIGIIARTWHTSAMSRREHPLIRPRRRSGDDRILGKGGNHKR